MKMRNLMAAGLLFGGLAVAGCSTTTIGDVTVTLAAANNGADLVITWTAAEGANSYTVTIDGSTVYTGTALTTTVDSSNVGASIVVTPEGGNATTTDISVVVTDNVIAGTISQVPVPSWLKFDFTNGTVSAVTSSENASAHLFIGGAVGGPYDLNSNLANNPTWDPFESAGGASFANADFAPGAGAWSDPYAIAEGAVAYCWLDNTGSAGWGTNDYYAKVLFSTVNTTTDEVTMKWGVNTAVPGLRWVPGS